MPIFPIRGEAAPEVLELRIHGVNNTTPHDLLAVTREEVEQVKGDALGSFWTLTPTAEAHGRAAPESSAAHIPARVRREAYSWGNLARNTVAFPAGAQLVKYLSNAAWLFLVPLGLTNAAYWSRRLGPPGVYGRGAATTRIFGLLLTLLTVGAFATASMDLAAVQCFASAATCGPLSGLTWPAGLSSGQRLALAAAVPLAALAVLFWVSRTTIGRYEAPVAGRPETGLTAADSARAATPMLAAPNLWSRSSLARSMASAHFAAGACLVSLILSWAVLDVDPAGCQENGRLVGLACVGAAAGAAGARLPLAVGAVAAILLVSAVVVVARSRIEDTDADRGRGGRLVVLSLLTLVAAVLTTLSAPTVTGGRIVGLGAATALIAVAALALALAALGWRRRDRSHLAFWAGAIVVGIGLAMVVLDVAPELVLGALLVLLGLAGVLALPSRAGRRDRGPGPVAGEAEGSAAVEGWGGRAPGVFLFLALGLQVALSAIGLIAFRIWLGTPADPCPSNCPGVPAPPADLALPSFYADFAGFLVLFLGALVLGLGIGAWALWARSRRIPAAALGLPAAELRRAWTHDQQVLRPAGRPSMLMRWRDLRQRLYRARRLAAYAHRAETLVGWLAGAFAASIAGAAIADGSDWSDPGRAPALWPELVAAGPLVLALLWTSLVLGLLTADKGVRPLGLIWDLMCFLPRSAHPYGPPSYADRAVPEVSARMDAWLRGDDVPTPPDQRSRSERAAVSRRSVVLSAHSLGAVVAAAALFTSDGAAPEQGRGRSGRVALLTYGTQLRAYFGRFFPELLGPEILGTAGVRRARWWSADPWAGDLGGPGAPTTAARSGLADVTLAGLLSARSDRTPAWVNIWRRTDYLGFPVLSHRPNLIDRAAEEIDATGYLADVATHGGYQKVPAYLRAFREVRDRL